MVGNMAQEGRRQTSIPAPTGDQSRMGEKEKIERGARVMIYPNSDKSAAADTGKVICYNAHNKTYTVALDLRTAWVDVAEAEVCEA